MTIQPDPTLEAALGHIRALLRLARINHPLATGSEAETIRLARAFLDASTLPEAPPATLQGEGDTNHVDLKTWPVEFSDVAAGRKLFEIRSHLDRAFSVGMTLKLREWNPDDKRYTGLWVSVRVIHLMRGPAFGLPATHTLMSIALIPTGTGS